MQRVLQARARSPPKEDLKTPTTANQRHRRRRQGQAWSVLPETSRPMRHRPTKCVGRLFFIYCSLDYSAGRSSSVTLMVSVLSPLRTSSETVSPTLYF